MREIEIWFSSFQEATSTSTIGCPKMGQYKSSKSYRPSIALSTCSIGVWTLSIGCESKNHSELSLSSSCQHEIVSDVQVITSIRGVCVGSWRTNDRFQRTLVVYEGSRAFCLVKRIFSLDFSNELKQMFLLRFNRWILRSPVGFQQNQVVQNSIHRSLPSKTVYASLKRVRIRRKLTDFQAKISVRFDGLNRICCLLPCLFLSFASINIDLSCYRCFSLLLLRLFMEKIIKRANRSDSCSSWIFSLLNNC